MRARRFVEAALSAAAIFICGPLPSIACDDVQRGPIRSVSRVIDGETVALDDGTVVRLIGALAPRARDADADPEFWQPEQEARAALERLVAGRSVELTFSGRRSDRYGRTLAHLFVTAPGRREWVQAYLVENGYARAYALPDSGGCLSALLARELNARSRGLGLWGNATYQPRSALGSFDLLRRRGTFQLVTGVVRQVSDVRGQVFLNFGDDWRQDFTVSIDPTVRRGFTAAGIDVRSLEGRRIRVRGWIERHNGPLIRLIHPHELELEPDRRPAAR